MQSMKLIKKLFQLRISTRKLTHYLTIKKLKFKSKISAEPSASADTAADLEWPPYKEDFVIILEEQEWSLGCVQSYSSELDQIQVQSLEPLKTRAKDDQGRTYWIYSTVEGNDFYKRKHVLDLRPSVILAKNIKRKDPFFALLNRKIIEGLTNLFTTLISTLFMPQLLRLFLCLKLSMPQIFVEL